MTTQTWTLDQIRRAGLSALARELGPVGMVRFLQQYETGEGDYSAQRHSWLDAADVGSLADQIRRQRQGGKDNTS